MAGNKLFKDRHPQTLDLVLEGDEWDLYEAVTNFVAKELREIRGSDPPSRPTCRHPYRFGARQVLNRSV